MLRAFMLALLFVGCASFTPSHYTPPPSLDDGIDVGHLTHSPMNKALVERLLVELHAQEPSVQQVHSLLIYHKGRLWVEEYFRGNNDVIRFREGVLREPGPEVQWHRDRKHYVASVNKALTATIAGMVLAQHNLSVDQPLASLLPEKQTAFDDPNKAAITLHDTLTMQLGFVWDEWESDDLVRLWQSEDFADFLLHRDNTGPGETWAYNSAAPNLLLRALDNLTDEPIRDWADRAFYQKLGIRDYHWESQPGGLPEGSARMAMRPRDMLKVGITYLNGGAWQGEQLIPKAWVEAVFQQQADSEPYSYYFWLRELDGVRYLSADGDGGQYINIFPEQDLVVVMTQGNYLEWPLYHEQAERIMADYILPAISPVTQ